MSKYEFASTNSREKLNDDIRAVLEEIKEYDNSDIVGSFDRLVKLDDIESDVDLFSSYPNDDSYGNLEAVVYHLKTSHDMRENFAHSLNDLTDDQVRMMDPEIIDDIQRLDAKTEAREAFEKAMKAHPDVSEEWYLFSETMDRDDFNIVGQNLNRSYADLNQMSRMSELSNDPMMMNKQLQQRIMSIVKADRHQPVPGEKDGSLMRAALLVESDHRSDRDQGGKILQNAQNEAMSSMNSRQMFARQINGLSDAQLSNIDDRTMQGLRNLDALTDNQRDLSSVHNYANNMSHNVYPRESNRWRDVSKDFGIDPNVDFKNQFSKSLDKPFDEIEEISMTGKSRRERDFDQLRQNLKDHVKSERANRKSNPNYDHDLGYLG